MLSFIKRHKKATIFSFLGMLLLLVYTFSRPLTYLALDFYDAHITPYNGQCAYRVLNNSCSCSEYFRNIVDKKGVVSAVFAMPKQFYHCNLAFKEIKLRAQEGGSGEEKKMDADDWCCLGCGLGSAACCATILFGPYLAEQTNTQSGSDSNNGDSTDKEYNTDKKQDNSPQSDTTDYESDTDEEEEYSLPLL